jgi:ribonuclease HII
MSPEFAIERLLAHHGYRLLAGADEAGVGALAGPVCAAVVVMPVDLRLPDVNDSKQLSPKMRESLFSLVITNARDYQVAMVSPAEIDAVNIYQATNLAVERAFWGLHIMPELLLTDGRIKPRLTCNMLPLIKGDARSHTIACASILAKVSRDHLMAQMDERYPGYNFAGHKGYATKEHLKYIDQLGPSPIHRLCYSPVGRSYQNAISAEGNYGEDLACLHLLDKGYFILARNYTRGKGEIDIIARDGATLVFVEVKTSYGGDKGDVAKRVGSAKTERIVLAAKNYLRENFSRPPLCRFDLMLVDLKKVKDDLFSEEKPYVEHFPGELRLNGF